MSADHGAGDDPGAVLADARVESDHLRAALGAAGDPLLVVGCVHDHPASVARVRTVVETLEPDVVAVELPGLAVPLFERVGRESPTAGTRGGEMSAALATGARVGSRRVGVDTLDRRFARSLASELRAASVNSGTLRDVLRSVTAVGRHALSCRLAAALGPRSPVDPVARRAFEHDVDASTDPPVQADDERRQLTRSLSVLRALERPVADEVVDAARERTMAANLGSLVASESVVCVVGFDHLENVADQLANRCDDVCEPDGATLRDHWSFGASP